MREGKLRAAGVSNFNLDQMAELVRIATIKPALLQSNSGEAPRRPRMPLLEWLPPREVHV